jgi:hypothetical protein
MLVSRVVERIQKRLRIAQSVHATVYAEDPIIEQVQAAFDFYCNLRWWPQFRNDATWALDGTTGRVVGPLGTLERLEQIRYIWHGTNTQPLAMMPEDMRPSLIPGSTYARFFVGDAAKVFRVAPFEAVGEVEVVYYSQPARLYIDSEIDFDETLLVLNGALRYLVSSDTNSNDAALIQTELAEYWRVYENRVFGQDIATSPSSIQILGDWRCG